MDGPLWAALRAGAAPAQVEKVEQLVQHATALLKLVVRTFPTYTLHDEQHARNVTALMGKLLARRAGDLSGLDAAILILAAYYHDIGMVYREEELAQLPGDAEYGRFLREHPESYLAVRDAGDAPPPVEVLEGYCRWRHADRVAEHLNDCPAELLRWDDTDIRPLLIAVCRSHNLDASTLRGPAFDALTVGGQKCEPRVYAVLLRLADLLDFDNSRSPRAIYEHLGLSRRTTARHAFSDAEWRKHLASRGFTFPDRQEQNYQLGFAARPADPAVEHDMRTFLDTIDEEIRRCRVLLGFSDRWRDLPLPGGIERTGIHGDGYRYGEFRFQMDRDAVLGLFMGEQLYEDPYAFLRELAQNALDTVRAREHLRGAIEPPAVEFTWWEDEARYIWVRCDDTGLGMDEEDLLKYFLRVGKSYYRSSEFQVELLRAARAGSFVPISRFGIGVLSCFIAGDMVELSSRKVLAGGDLADPVRLTIRRDEEFFVLQSGDLKPAPRPSSSGPEKGYRSRCGTSLAVRIDPAKALVDADRLLEKLNEYVLCPPVPVTANGRSVGAYTPDELTRPFLPEPTSVVTQPDGRASTPPGNPYLGPLELRLYPVDITALSRRPELSGQLLVIVPCTPTFWLTDEDEQVLRAPFDAIDRRLWRILVRSNPTWSVSGVPTPEGLRLKIVVSIHAVGWWTRWMLWSLLSRRQPPVFPRRGWLEFEDERLVTWQELGVRHPLEAARWCHNGVALPGVPSKEREFLGPTEDLLMLGVVSLADDLRPDLTVSRSAIIGASFPLRSAIELVRRNSSIWASSSMRLTVLDVDLDLGETPLHTVDEVLADPLIAGGEWEEVPVLRAVEPQQLGNWVEGDEGLLFSDDQVSIRDLRSMARSDTKPLIEVSTGPDAAGFRRVLAACLVQTRLDVRAVAGRGGKVFTPLPTCEAMLRVLSGDVPVLPPGLLRFRPLFFVRYEAAPATLLKRPYMPVNLDHPLAQWFVAHADALATRAPAVFARLRDALDREPAATPTPNDEVNRLLDRVARVLPELKPSSDAYLGGAVRTEEWHSR